MVICDIWLGLLYHSKILKRLSFMTGLAIITRILIFGGGKEGWLYGYMLYYILFCSIVSWTIARKHFPYATAISEDKMKDASSEKKVFVDVTTHSEFIFIFTTVAYVISVAMIQVFKPKGVTPPLLTVFGMQFTYVFACLISLCLVATIFFVINIRRTFYRKKHNLKRKVSYFLGTKRFAIFEIFCLCLYICVVAWSFVFYWISKSWMFVIAGCVCPAIMYFFMQGWLNFIKNDGYFL